MVENSRLYSATGSLKSMTESLISTHWFSMHFCEDRRGIKTHWTCVHHVLMGGFSEQNELIISDYPAI